MYRETELGTNPKLRVSDEGYVVCKTGKPKRRAVEMSGKLINIVKYSSTYQSKALLLLFRMVITGAMIDDHIAVVFTLE